MTVSFDPAHPPIILEGWVTGPRRTVKVRLALDTGATDTLIRATVLAAAGIVPPATAPRRRMRSATGGATAPFVRVRQLLVLGRTRADFPVAAFDLPPAVMYDGLLGLDFFRGLVLTLDFARGLVRLDPRRPWWRFWG
ncbi:MAG: hypothetical protein C0501_05810 [Isosphaera sp.]|nr:hypothetical protein [Isosphaera sp.]